MWQIMAAHEASVVTDIMTRMDGMYPFYRQGLQTVPASTLGAVNMTFGSLIRQDYKLWHTFPHQATDASRRIVFEVWRRLG